MEVIKVLTKEDATRLFPRAMQELAKLAPGPSEGEVHVIGIVAFPTISSESMFSGPTLATWEEQPTRPRQGVLYWYPTHNYWDY